MSNSIEQLDWAVIVASIITLLASLVTIYFARKSSIKSDATNHKLGEMQAKTFL